MKILIYSNGYNSFRNHRFNLFALDQAKALKEAGHDVRLASVDSRSIARLRRPGEYTFNLAGMKCYTSNYVHFPVSVSWRTEQSKKKAKRLFSRICKEWRPDVVHAHFLGSAYVLSSPVCDAGIPFVITEHFSRLNTPNPPEDLARMARETYPKASALLAVSSSLAQNIAAFTGLTPEVVHNVVDVDKFALQDRKERKAPSPFVFLSCGRLNSGKGFDILLKALARITTPVKLIIMGGGAENRNLHKLARELGLEDKVTFFGAYTRDEMKQNAKEADCFVLASRSETFGVVYVEAMATGLPVIATRCQGPTDFVTEEVGKLVPVDDVEALQKEMERMIIEKNSYNPGYISEYARRNFAPAVIANQLTKIYNRVCEQC